MREAVAVGVPEPVAAAQGLLSGVVRHGLPPKDLSRVDGGTGSLSNVPPLQLVHSTKVAQPSTSRGTRDMNQIDLKNRVAVITRDARGTGLATPQPFVHSCA